MTKQTQNRESILFPEPTVSATCGGIPVRSYGYTHIYGASPNLVDSKWIQAGNESPQRKIRLKRSSEISSNYLGGTTPRMPRTPENDYLPLEPIHLIDGDPTTCWCSRTVPQSDAEPAWIRIDLASEKLITGVTLRKRLPGAARNQVGSMWPDEGAVEVGMAIPANLEVRISRDAMNWETVFIGASNDTPESRAFHCDFAPLVAKIIWITGSHFARVENWHYSFSVSSVEVIDSRGDNVALVSLGTGATVSSTIHSGGQTREEHHRLWPVFADLGIKWIRIGYHDDPVNWHWIEKVKGTLEVDPEADAAVTHAVDNGVDVVLALGFGNRFYTQEDPSRNLPQLWEWYYENPKPPTTQAALKGWRDYVRFMCRHFKNRIKVFEVWNEWNIDPYWGDRPSVADYIAVAKVAIPIIREECPDAKVMLGSTAGFCHGFATWTPKELADAGARSVLYWLVPAVRELAKDVDLIGWHPFYQTDPTESRVLSYRADVEAFKAWAALQGFRGECWCTEYNYGASYPPPTGLSWWGGFVCSEVQKAKYIARLSIQHTSLNMGSFFCEVWGNANYSLDLSLMRRTFSADPISPCQPQAAYYAMRNLSTALDGLHQDSFPVDVDGAADVEVCTMSRPGERVVALWTTGLATDECSGTPFRLDVEGHFSSVTGFDCMNGVEQEVAASRSGAKTIIDGILVRDYPILLRLASGSAS